MACIAILMLLLFWVSDNWPLLCCYLFCFHVFKLILLMISVFCIHCQWICYGKNFENPCYSNVKEPRCCQGCLCTHCWILHSNLILFLGYKKEQKKRKTLYDCRWPWQPTPWLLETFVLVLGTGFTHRMRFYFVE